MSLGLPINERSENISREITLARRRDCGVPAGADQPVADVEVVVGQGYVAEDVRALKYYKMGLIATGSR